VKRAIIRVLRSNSDCPGAGFHFNGHNSNTLTRFSLLILKATALSFSLSQQGGDLANINVVSRKYICGELHDSD
jgi:hypothetical protein